MSAETIKSEKSSRTSKRKIRMGVVCSDKMDKTITVIIKGKKKYPLYGKTVSFFKKFKAHDEKNEASEGDFVEIMESRPISKLKRWRLTRIIEKRK